MLHNSSFPKKTLFQAVYDLAKEKNAKGLTDLQESFGDYCIHVEEGLYTPITLLAKEGDAASVLFLIDICQCSGCANPKGLYYALIGFAMNGDALVDTILAGNNNLSLWAIYGYILAGNDAKAESLIKQADDLSYPLVIKAYAIRGNLDRVLSLIETVIKATPEANQRKQLVKLIMHAIEGFAFSGFEKHIEVMQKKSPNLPYSKILIAGYAESGYHDKAKQFFEKGEEYNYPFPFFKCSDENIAVFYLTFTRAKYRKELAEHIAVHNPNLRADTLETKATKLRSLMTHFICQVPFTYDQAQAYLKLTLGDKIWFYQGRQQIGNLLLQDIFIHIATFILGLPLRDTLLVYQAMVTNLFQRAEIFVKQNVRNGVLSTDESIVRAQIHDQHLKASLGSLWKPANTPQLTETQTQEKQETEEPAKRQKI